MGYYINADSITLTDGTVIHKDDEGSFPPYDQINPNQRPCEVCPVRPLCQDNAAFKCATYGMFDGAYWSFDDVVEFLLRLNTS